MKKDLSIALSGIMAVLMLTGCGQKTETEVAPTKVKVISGQTFKWRHLSRYYR